MTDDLELRLRNLSSSAALRPVDERAIENLHLSEPAARRQDGSPRAIQVPAIAVAVLIAILIANVVVAYFAPKYERALAQSGVGPISQRMLAAVGLRDGDVTTVGDLATSAGHTIELAAGYADGLRTVLLLTIDGRGLSGNPKTYGLHPGEYGITPDDISLTDQFGHGYDLVGLSGPTDFQFQTLSWPASDLGARLTVHITGIWAIWMGAERGPGTTVDTEALTVHGDWTLHATLISAPAHAIALPAPIHTALADYTFTGISATETEMVLHWTVAGAINDQLARDRAAAPPSTDPLADPLFDQYLRPHVYSDAGAELQMQDWGFTSPKTGPGRWEMTVFIQGPGRYRVQLGTVAEPRWVVVP